MSYKSYSSFEDRGYESLLESYGELTEHRRRFGDGFLRPTRYHDEHLGRWLEDDLWSSWGDASERARGARGSLKKMYTKLYIYICLEAV